MDSLGFEYMEWDTNRAYWGDLAAEWRDAEIRLVCIVCTFRPIEKPKAKPRRERLRLV